MNICFLVISSLVSVVLCEPPVNSYLPPSRVQGNRPSPQYGPPGSQPRGFGQRDPQLGPINTYSTPGQFQVQGDVDSQYGPPPTQGHQNRENQIQGSGGYRQPSGQSQLNRDNQRPSGQFGRPNDVSNQYGPPKIQGQQNIGNQRQSLGQLGNSNEVNSQYGPPSFQGQQNRNNQGLSSGGRRSNAGRDSVSGSLNRGSNGGLPEPIYGVPPVLGSPETQRGRGLDQTNPQSSYGPPSIGAESSRNNGFGSNAGKQSFAPGKPQTSYDPPATGNYPPGRGENNLTPSISDSDLYPKTNFGTPGTGKNQLRRTQGNNQLSSGLSGSYGPPNNANGRPTGDRRPQDNVINDSGYDISRPSFGDAETNQVRSQSASRGRQDERPSESYGPPGSGERGSFTGANGGGYNDEDSDEPAKYEFSYDVDDPQTGTKFGHSEQRDGDTTTGEYNVVLPDGRKQIVEYEAGRQGYKPQIRYEGGASSGAGFGQGNSGQDSSVGYQTRPNQNGPNDNYSTNIDEEGYPEGGPGSGRLTIPDQFQPPPRSQAIGQGPEGYPNSQGNVRSRNSQAAEGYPREGPQNGNRRNDLNQFGASSENSNQQGFQSSSSEGYPDGRPQSQRPGLSGTGTGRDSLRPGNQESQGYPRETPNSKGSGQFGGNQAGRLSTGRDGNQAQGYPSGPNFGSGRGFNGGRSSLQGSQGSGSQGYSNVGQGRGENQGYPSGGSVRGGDQGYPSGGAVRGGDQGYPSGGPGRAGDQGYPSGGPGRAGDQGYPSGGPGRAGDQGYTSGGTGRGGDQGYPSGEPSGIRGSGF